MYDLFVSYNWRDREMVEDVARTLRERGLKPFLDRWYLIPGRSWVEALERSFKDCKGIAIFLGPHGMGRWQQREKELALDRQSQVDSLFVVPVLLPGADPALGFLSLNTWVDLRNGTPPEAIDTLVGAALGRTPEHLPTIAPVDAAAAICPYRGLRPFREEDQPFFCGRETFAHLLLTTIDKRDVVAVVGASGSGKSSVVRAGLIPKLRRQSGRVWDIITMLPQDRPFHSLAASILPLLESELSEFDRLTETEKFARALACGDLQLRTLVERALEKQPGTDRLLLFVDQWEELFTLCRDDVVRQRFVAQILESTQSSNLSLVLTLRGDFYGHVLGERQLSDRLQGGVVNIGPMTREESQRAIEEPAEKVGLRFEDGLIERILDELGEEPGILPLLEFLLTELFDRQRGRQLLHEAYDAIGGVRRAIAERAEQAFAKLSESEQEAAHWALLALVVPSEGSEDTRRRAVLEELGGAARSVIAKLATDRLLVTTRDSVGRDVVEVGHEALIREWKRLRDWVDEDRDFLRTLRRLEEEAAFWDADKRDPELLLHASRRLAEAADLLEARPQAVGSLAKAYITASLAADKRRQQQAIELASRQRVRRLQGVAVATSLLFFISVGFGYILFQQRKVAGDLAEQAARNFGLALDSATKLVEKTAEYRQRGQEVSAAAARELLRLAEGTLGELDNLSTASDVTRKKIRSQQIGLLLTISDAFVDLGALGAARARAEQARELSEQLIGVEPNNLEWQRRLYGAYFRIGDMMVSEHKYADAQAEYELARRIADRLAIQQPEVAGWQIDRIFIYNKIGDGFRGQKNMNDARSYYDEALTIAESLIAAEPNNDDAAHQASATRTRIGQLMVDQGDVVGALEQYKIAMTISKAIAERNPHDLSRQFTLAVRYSRLCLAFKLLADLESSLAACRQALQIRLQLTKKDGSNLSYLDHLASSYVDMGELFQQKGDWAVAVEHYRRGVAIREDLVLKDPDNKDWQLGLARARKLLEAVSTKPGPAVSGPATTEHTDNSDR